MKRFLLQRSISFRCTPDPYSGVIGEIHPNYPAGEGIVQPVIEDGYGSLMDNREYLDERLKMINAELDKLKEGTTGEVRRSMSPDVLFSRRSRSGGRDPGFSSGRNRSRSRNRSSRRSRSKGGDLRGIGSRRSRSRDGRSSIGGRDGNGGRDGDLLGVRRRRSRSPAGGSSRRRERSRSKGRKRDKRRSRSRSKDLKLDLKKKRDSSRREQGNPDLRDQMLQLIQVDKGFGDRVPSPNQAWTRRRRINVDDADARKPVHDRLGPRTSGGSDRLGPRTSDSSAPRPMEDTEQMSEISNDDNIQSSDVELSDLSDMEPDLDNKGEKEAKGMKIELNLGAKDNKKLTRKIVVDKEVAKAKEYKYATRVGCKLETKPSLPDNKELLSFLTSDEPTPNTLVEFESTAKVARKIYDDIEKVIPEGTKLCMHEGNRCFSNNGAAMNVLVLGIQGRIPGHISTIMEEYGVYKKTRLEENGLANFMFTAIIKGHTVIISNFIIVNFFLLIIC